MHRGGAITLVQSPSLWSTLTRAAGEAPTSIEPAAAIKQDVLDHIHRLLNTRRGRCMGHPEYGMPDITEFPVNSRGLARLGREIQSLIERWEPRLAPGVRVRVLGSPRAGTDSSEGVFRATFEVRARLIAPYGDPCTFKTTILLDGRAEVKP